MAHVIKRVTQDEPRSIADQNPEIPPWLIEIINSLLEKKAVHRFHSAEDLAAVLDQHLSRIQHPNESGSHTAINEKIPNRANAALQRVPKSVAPSEPVFSPLSFLERSPQVIVPDWMRSTSRIFAIVCVVVWILVGLTAMEGNIGIGGAEFFVLSFLNLGPFLMAILLSRPTITREALAIALFLGFGPIGLLVYLWIKDDLTLAASPTGHIPLRNPKPPVNAPITNLHSAMNEQVSARGSTGSMPGDTIQNATSLSGVTNDKGGLTTKIALGWLSYRFEILSVILVVASMLILPSLWLVSLAVRDAVNGNRLSILDPEFWQFVFAQKMPTLAVLGTMIAAAFQTLFIFLERRKHRRMTLLAYSQAANDFDSKPVNAAVASSTSENV